MFKLQLQEENGLKTQTLSFHLNNAALTITLHSPLFSGTQDKVDNSLKRCFVGRCGLSSSLFLHKLRPGVVPKVTFTLGSSCRALALCSQVKCVIPGLKEKSITEMAVKLVRHIHRNPLRAIRMPDHRILSMEKKTRLTASEHVAIKPTVKGKCRWFLKASQTLWSAKDKVHWTDHHSTDAHGCWTSIGYFLKIRREMFSSGRVHCLILTFCCILLPEGRNIHKWNTNSYRSVAAVTDQTVLGSPQVPDLAVVACKGFPILTLVLMIVEQ